MSEAFGASSGGTPTGFRAAGAGALPQGPGMGGSGDYSPAPPSDPGMGKINVDLTDLFGSIAGGIQSTGSLVGAASQNVDMIGGVPVPKSVLQELVSYYSKSATQPDGVNFEAPFRLPAHIREIRTTLGQALVVQ